MPKILNNTTTTPSAAPITL